MKFVAICLTAIGILSATAATPTTFNILCINRTDGATERLMLHTALDVKLDAEGTLKLVHPELTVELPAGTVSNFTFENNAEATTTYDGDHQAGIDSPEAPDAMLQITPDGITSAADICVYDLKGVKVAGVRADQGSARISASALPKGVYIVKSGTSTLKIRL